MADTKAKSKVKKKQYICGTPTEYCCGGLAKPAPALQKTVHKSHTTPEDCFACYSTYLVDVLKYVPVGGREFAPPDGGPIRVLTKKSRFGARLRGGKEERMMPQQFLSGSVLST